MNNSTVVIDCYYKQTILFKHRRIFLLNIADVEIVLTYRGTKKLFSRQIACICGINLWQLNTNSLLHTHVLQQSIKKGNDEKVELGNGNTSELTAMDTYNILYGEYKQIVGFET